MTTATATLDSPPPAPAAAPPAETPGWLTPTGGPRFVATRGELLAAFVAMAPLTKEKERAGKAVLNCYRLAAGPDGVTVEATRLEQSARATLAQAESHRPGAYCVPAEHLRDALASSGADSAELDCGGGRCVVTTADGRWTINAVDPAPWHLSGEAWPEPLGTVPAAALKRLLSQVVPCVSREASRYAATGVLLTPDGPKGKRLAAVATDGRRLAFASEPWAGKPFPASILPLVAAAALLPALPDDGDVGLWASAGDRDAPAGVAFLLPDGFALRSNVLEGQFPPYADAIPKYDDNGPRLAAGRQDLLDALNRSAVVIPPETKGKAGDQAPTSRGLRLSLGAHGLRLSARDPNAGESETVLAGGKFQGADMDIGLNADFLRDAVRACEGPGVTLRFGGPNRAVLVKDGGGSFKAVVMPLNLQ